MYYKLKKIESEAKPAVDPPLPLLPDVAVVVDLVEKAVVDPVVSALIHHVTDLAHVISAQVTNTVMLPFVQNSSLKRV